MAPENDQGPSDQGENAVMEPLFIKKQPLNEEKKIEMEKEVESVRESMRAVKVMWETLANVCTQKEEAGIVCGEFYMDQAKEKVVGYFNLTPYKTRSAVSKQVKTIGLDENAVRHYHEVWSDSIEKTLRQQKMKTRYAVKKWFEFLHQFDGNNLQPTPSRSSEPSFNLIYFVLVAVICATYAIMPSGSEEASVSESELLASFQENILKVLGGVFNFYLTFHNVTIDYTEATGIAFDDK